jgi:hypothetical protein
MNDLEEMLNRLSHDETLRYAALELACQLDDENATFNRLQLAESFRRFIAGDS